LGSLPQLQAASLHASDLEAEGRLIKLLVTAADRGLFRSAHDCSHGGLARAG